LLGAGMKVTSDKAHEIQRLSQNNVDAAVRLASAQDALWQLRYGFPQFMVSNAEVRARIVADEAKWAKTIDEELTAYARGQRAPEETAALNELREIYGKYMQARPKWFELIAAGKNEEAADWRAKTTTPFGAGTVKAFGRQIDLQKKLAREHMERVESELSN